MDNINRKTILILGLALSLVISLLTLLFQQDLREKMGSSFYVVGLAIIGCILLVLAGYVWDRTMIERLRGLRESAGPLLQGGDEDPDHDEIIGLARNIENMARSLQKVEASYRGIVEDQVDLICRYRPDGRITFVNGSYARAFGRKRSELVGELIPFMDAGQISENDTRQKEQNLTTAEGEIACMLWAQRPISDDCGNLLEFQAVGHDITERKNAEAALLAAKEAAEDADRAKGEFLAVVSHEIRTPINGIMGFADMLSGSELSSEQNEQVSMIRTSGVALGKLINDILDLSKIEAGKVEIEHSPYALHKCIQEVTALLERDARENGLKLKTKIANDVPVIVNGDETRLRQILTNLIGNALKFTEVGGVTIEISCSKSPPANDGLCNIRLFFSITDTGIGIPADKISQLFRPFIQVDTSMQRRRNGTGLGLAICKRLCELMGGTISVESSEGSGSVFRFTLQTNYEKGDTSPPMA